MVEKEYDALKKKYSLPDFKALDAEFEVSTIEKPDFLLRAIKKKISEKLEPALDLVAKMIQPETTSIADLYEYRCFDSPDKKKLFELYCKIMLLHRKLLETDFLLDDAADAAAISLIAKEWPELRKQIIPFVKELETCWEKKPEADTELRGYLG